MVKLRDKIGRLANKIKPKREEVQAETLKKPEKKEKTEKIEEEDEAIFGEPGKSEKGFDDISLK